MTRERAIESGRKTLAWLRVAFWTNVAALTINVLVLAFNVTLLFVNTFANVIAVFVALNVACLFVLRLRLRNIKAMITGLRHLRARS